MLLVIPKRVHDAPQYMDPDQNGVQYVPNNQTEVQPSDRTNQTARAVYRLDSSGMELRLDPRPDSQTDDTTDDLSRPSRQAKSNGRARMNLTREESDSDRSYSLLARLAHTACSEERTGELSSLFDQYLSFDHLNFSKARILQLSRLREHLDQISTWKSPNRQSGRTRVHSSPYRRSSFWIR